MKWWRIFLIVVLVMGLCSMFSCAHNDDDPSTSSGQADNDTGDDDSTDDDAVDDDSGDDDISDDDIADDDSADDDDDNDVVTLNNNMVWGRYICGMDMSDATLVTMGSYNLYGGNYSTAAEMAAGLADHQFFDILIFQECPGDYAGDIAAALGMYSFFYDGRAILSYTELLDPTGIPLLKGRSVAHARTFIDGVEFSIYSVHVSWNADGDAQCRELVDEVLSNDPVPRILLGGDWNDEPGSTQFDILFEVLADGWSSLGVVPSQRITWPANLFYGSEGAQLIDNNLFNKTSGACAVDGEIVNFSPVLSDHKLQISTIAFPPTAAPQPPYLLDVALGFGDDAIALLFDKPMAQASVSITMDGEALTVENVTPIGDGELVLVTLNEAMLVGAPIEVLVTAGEDVDGNSMIASESLTFTHHGNRIIDNGFEEGGAAWSLDKMEVKDKHWWGVDAIAGEKFISGLALFKSRGTARQTIDLADDVGAIDAGRAYIEFGGLSRTGYMTEDGSNVARPYDEAEAVAEVYNADGRLLAWYTSGRLDTLYWQPWRVVEPLPPGAREIRVTLRAVGGMFGLLFNAASFDALHLAVIDAGEPHFRVSGNLLVNPLFDNGFDGWEKNGPLLIGKDRYAGPIAYADVNSFTGEHWVAGITTLANVGLSQTVDLSAFTEQVDAGRLTAWWGGAMRPIVGLSEVTLTLTFSAENGDDLATDQIGPYRAAEWFGYESQITAPNGARTVTYQWQGGSVFDLEAVFLDAPFIFLLQEQELFKFN